MENRRELKILQIIPATGWVVVYLTDESDGNNNFFTTCPLACWALMEDQNGEREIRGMDADNYLEDCEEVSNFYVYCYENDLLERKKWFNEAALKKIAKKKQA